MNLLTGIALQQAIAEKKGWSDIGRYGALQLSGREHPQSFHSIIPDWDTDIRAAHALLAELVGDHDDWSRVVSVVFCQESVTVTAYLERESQISEIEVVASDPPDFCAAVGNLWLRCGE